MRYINTYNINPNDLNQIKIYFEEKGLSLKWISKSVNGFAIAQVSLIETPEDIEEQSDFQVVIDLKKEICCKFNFRGYRTDGLRIYNLSKINDPKFYHCYFNVSFIDTINGFPTSYILITYKDFEYDSLYDDGNYEGKIYATIIDFSASENHNNCAVFKFSDCLHYDNSVKIYLIDDEEYPELFAFRLITKDYYDNDDDDIMECEQFDGIWNKSFWCTDQQIIPLESDNLFHTADIIMDKIREEQQDSQDDYI